MQPRVAAALESEPPRLLTSGQVARILSISMRTVTRLADEGRIPGAIKIGGQWRFLASEILGLLGESAKCDPVHRLTRTR